MEIVVRPPAGEIWPCPVCRGAMRLVGIESDDLPTDADEIYTFECGVCGMTTAEAATQPGLAN